jgi:hypothetical protein
VRQSVVAVVVAVVGVLELLVVEEEALVLALVNR